MKRGPSVRARAATAMALVVTAGLLTALPGCGLELAGKDDNLVSGKKLFVQKCGSCHVMGRASTKGVVGPDLDQAFGRALKDGFGRSTVKGLVASQIDIPNERGIQAGPTPQEGKAPKRTVMPADLVKGKDAQDVAAYVAYAAAKPGKDSGALATAVEQSGAGKPIAAKNGTIDIPADPNGQLLFLTKMATAPAGPLVVSSKNASSTPHNIALEGPGVKAPPGPIVQGGAVSKLQSADLKPGKYTFLCTVPGHAQAGMKGMLTVK
ncbi:MAG: c-type cytochrome [Solirubrobacteraceae bacterium]